MSETSGISGSSSNSRATRCSRLRGRRLKALSQAGLRVCRSLALTARPTAVWRSLAASTRRTNSLGCRPPSSRRRVLSWWNRSMVAPSAVMRRRPVYSWSKSAFSRSKSCTSMPSASALSRALMSLDTKITRLPSPSRRKAVAMMRLSGMSRSMQVPPLSSFSMVMSTVPPSSVGTPRPRLPWPRSPSRVRITRRALRPSSSLFFLNLSNSSITVIGRTTVLSAKQVMASLLCRSTLVSRTKNLLDMVLPGRRCGRG